MSTPTERREVYLTPRWRAIRATVLADAGHLCALCICSDGRTIGATEVHHMRPIREGGDPFARENLIALCRNCHLAAHEKPERPASAAWRKLVNELT